MRVTWKTFAFLHWPRLWLQWNQCGGKPNCCFIQQRRGWCSTKSCFPKAWVDASASLLAIWKIEKKRIDTLPSRKSRKWHKRLKHQMTWKLNYVALLLYWISLVRTRNECSAWGYEGKYSRPLNSYRMFCCDHVTSWNFGRCFTLVTVSFFCSDEYQMDCEFGSCSHKCCRFVRCYSFVFHNLQFLGEWIWFCVDAEFAFFFHQKIVLFSSSSSRSLCQYLAL